jgi:hypothetical protein
LETTVGEANVLVLVFSESWSVYSNGKVNGGKGKAEAGKVDLLCRIRRGFADVHAIGMDARDNEGRAGKVKKGQDRGSANENKRGGQVPTGKSRVAELGSPSNRKKRKGWYKVTPSYEVTSEPPPSEMAGRVGRKVPTAYTAYLKFVALFCTFFFPVTS